MLHCMNGSIPTGMGAHVPSPFPVLTIVQATQIPVHMALQHTLSFAEQNVMSPHP
jgi:hypothetical protein